MDVTLHLGVHRTATTTFQNYLRENAEELATGGVGFWGPLRTRDGLLTGVMPVAGRAGAQEQLDRAAGRIAVRLDRAAARGVRHMLISDENMIGAPRRNLRDGRLYADIGQRMARFNIAFGGRVGRIAISIRSQEDYWSSALAYALTRGHPVPDREELDHLAGARRGWRDMITDLACAMPGVAIRVMPYEQFGGLPERKLQLMTGLHQPPRKQAREWMHRAPSRPQLRQILADRGLDPADIPEGSGRWEPFDRDQAHALREAYADDLFWLRAGADGLAELMEETGPVKTGTNPATAQTTRGRPHDIEERRLA